MKEKKGECIKCDKEVKYNTKFRIKNFPFVFALACEDCGLMYYY